MQEHKDAGASEALVAAAATSESVLCGPDRTFLRRGSGGDAENARLCKSQALGVFSRTEVYRLIICFKVALHWENLYLKEVILGTGCAPGPFPPFVADLAGSDRDRS